MDIPTLGVNGHLAGMSRVTGFHVDVVVCPGGQNQPVFPLPVSEVTRRRPHSK
jgi:hypothetical protein